MTGTETDPGFEQDGPDSAAERLAAALNPAPETAGDAVQWFRNGDHPDDDCHMVRPDPASLTQFAPFLSEGKVVRYFRRSGIQGTSTCPRCGETMHHHGWIDQGAEGITVCPGDWVAPDGSGGYRIVGRPEAAGGEPAEQAPVAAVQPRTPLGAPGEVLGDPGELRNGLSRAQDGPGEYRLRPSALSAWLITRETAVLIAGWCLGTWEAGEPIVVRIPTPYGLIAAPEGWSVVRYGTSATGAGLYWAVPGELFESAYVPGGQQ